MSLLEQLKELHDQHGKLTPVLVVEAARDPKHPLHPRFDWDDSVAAEKWRLTQASQLLRVTKLPSDPEKPRDLRAFVCIRESDQQSGEYRYNPDAMEDPFSRQLVLRAMEREWKAFKRRYEDQAEFAHMIRKDFPA